MVLLLAGPVRALRALLVVTTGAAAVASFISFMGCASKPKLPEPAPLERPAGVTIAIEQFAGTFLSGPIAADDVERAAKDAPPALRLSSKLFLVESLERASALAEGAEITTAPIVDSFALVADFAALTPVGATTQLASGGFIVHSDAARRLLEELLAGEGTSSLLVQEDESAVLTGASTAVVASRATEDARSSRFGVAVFGLDAKRAEISLQLEEPGAGSEVLKLEDEFTVESGPRLLVLPSPFSSRAAALWLELLPAPSDGGALARHQQEVQTALERIQAAAEVAAHPAPRMSADTARIEACLRGLQPGPTLRATLVDLAANAQAPLLGDLALVSTDAELHVLLERLQRAEPRFLPLRADRAALSWALEREAWRHLAASAFETALSLELTSMLERHAGAVATWVVPLDDMVTASADAEDFEKRLVAENRALLEDRNLGVRVRAFDWLAGRGKAPKGFDPLAPLEQRRAALAAEATNRG